MSDFIGDLEQELRAASTRRVRLAAARAPRPPATAIVLALSVAVCIAVAGAVLVGHTASGSGPSSPQHPITAPIPPSRSRDPILADCLTHNNQLTGSYTVAQLRHALSVMPTATKEYTNCPDVINRALLSALGSRNGKSTGLRHRRP